MSSSPQYRFTLDGNYRISEPIGWDKIKIELNRDPKYWSLVESVELPFEFYGNVADKDGGYEYLKQAKANGPDAQVEFLAEISWDYGDTWEVFFTGLIDMTSLVEVRNKRRFQCGITRESNWTRFYNLQDNVVQITSDDTIDNNVTLPPQKLRQIYQGSHGDDVSYSLPAGQYGIIDWRDTLRNEVGKVYNLPRVANSTLPVWKFELEFDGDYQIDGEIFLTSSATYPAGAPNQIPNIEVYIQINNAAGIIWTKTNLGVNGVDGRTRFVYSASHSLKKGDLIRVYFLNTSGGVQAFVWTDFFTQLFTVTADTTYRQTTATGFFIHDIADRILQNITGTHYLYSEYFGGTDTDYIDYNTDGCGQFYQLFKGIHIRDKDLSSKPFALSWNQLWTGLDPVFLLGAGYEYVTFDIIGGGSSEREMLVVMPREYFFDSSEQSVELEEYNEDFRLEVSYDPQFLITSVKKGYQKWQAQNISGIDDPQTVHDYTTRFKTVGDEGTKKIESLSTFIAASLAIEQGRRLSEMISQDWPLDEETFIIQTASPTTVNLYASAYTTGLNNGDTRYNIRLTPTSTFNRWLQWFSIAFQEYVGDTFRFAGGQGNTSMTFLDPAPAGCNDFGSAAVEDGDIIIPSNTDFMLPDVYKFQMGMTWEQYKAIRDNRKKSIALNYQEPDGERKRVVLFIDNLTYYPNDSKGEFKCWLHQAEEVISRFIIEVKLDYIDSVAGSPTWTATFTCEEAMEVLACTGGAPIPSISTDSNPAFFGGTRVMAAVTKISSGTTTGNTSIFWIQDGITVHTELIGSGGTVGTRTYEFVDVEVGQVIRVEIQEG